MSAPVKEKRVTVDWSRTATRKSDVPAQRGSVAVPAQRGRSGAAKAAYAKRDERVRRSAGVPRVARKAASPGGRAQFVLLIMVLFATGLVLTLWLSTAAAGDSYRLQAARTAARDLTEQSERLHREVAAMEAPPALAQRATDLGMVPSKDPARLVVAPDGGVRVVGTPAAATAPAAPVPAAPAAPAPNATAPNTAPNTAATAAAPNAAPNTAAANTAPNTAPNTQAVTDPGAAAAGGSADAAIQGEQERPAADQAAANQPAQNPAGTTGQGAG
ncbi:hypothetical protein GCM10009836_15110 [Pseudonocardia ailaonensis]|uniref:Cell division protein FtsL n=1 Tax=Pseudonocardia ailaonensis TaxID=367279 RepID=A0ABN2MVZ9_9PSEU